MEDVREALLALVEANQPMTVRQVFYRAVAAGLVQKMESEYRQTIDRLLVDMRLDEELPYEWIVDGTRRAQEPQTFSSVEEAASDWQATYQRNRWASQRTCVEVWCEKDALSGVIYPVTSTWHVPLLVTRGYPSITFPYDRAAVLEAEERPVAIYYLGDHDPSGLDIERNVQERLGEFAPGADLSFERLAVTPEQIAEYHLPTRPTKQGDSRITTWAGGGSVEGDALEPARLRSLVEQAIKSHVDAEAVDEHRRAESVDRGRIAQLLRSGIDGPRFDAGSLDRWLRERFGPPPGEAPA